MIKVKKKKFTQWLTLTQAGKPEGFVCPGEAFETAGNVGKPCTKYCNQASPNRINNKIMTGIITCGFIEIKKDLSPGKCTAF